jgi:hypothetical protein
VQLYRYFVSQSIEFCRHKPLCCFSTSVHCSYCLFRYRLSPEAFGYTLVCVCVCVILSFFCSRYGYFLPYMQTVWGIRIVSSGFSYSKPLEIVNYFHENFSVNRTKDITVHISEVKIGICLFENMCWDSPGKAEESTPPHQKKNSIFELWAIFKPITSAWFTMSRLTTCWTYPLQYMQYATQFSFLVYSPTTVLHI